MNDSIQIAQLVIDTAARCGHLVQVNARRPDPNAFQSALGRDRCGTRTLLRRPLPFEGGRTVMLTLPEEMAKGDMHIALSLWAMGDLGMAAKQRCAAKKSGSWLPPDATMLVDAVAFDIMEVELPGLKRAIAATDWKACDQGLQAAIEPGGDVAVHLIRRAHRMEIASAELPSGMMLSEKDGMATLSLRPAALPPMSAIAAMPGRPLADLVAPVPSAAGVTVASARIEGDRIEIVYRGRWRDFE